MSETKLLDDEVRRLTAELRAARAENERLRAALTQIANHRVQSGYTDPAAVARAALAAEVGDAT